MALRYCFLAPPPSFSSSCHACCARTLPSAFRRRIERPGWPVSHYCDRRLANSIGAPATSLQSPSAGSSRPSPTHSSTVRSRGRQARPQPRGAGRRTSSGASAAARRSSCETCARGTLSGGTRAATLARPRCSATGSDPSRKRPHRRHPLSCPAPDQSCSASRSRFPSRARQSPTICGAWRRASCERSAAMQHLRIATTVGRATRDSTRRHPLRLGPC